jgi:transcriptional regulator with XRE-family HTH domain
MGHVESLGEFIRRVRKEKNMSCADVSRRSTRKGQGQIAASYINRLENNPKLRPTADRLKALADGLGVPAEELFARVVGLSQEDESRSSDEIKLLARFREFSPERRDDLLRLVDMWYQKDLF